MESTVVSMRPAVTSRVRNRFIGIPLLVVSVGVLYSTWSGAEFFREGKPSLALPYCAWHESCNITAG
jgi:hypothetical protein